MKILPIPFSAPMVLAILAGRKTKTRRVSTSPVPYLLCPRCGCTEKEWKGGYHDDLDCEGTLEWTPSLKPRFHVGDILYLREAWRADVAYDAIPPRDLRREVAIRYEADEKWIGGGVAGRLRQGMHMPRWASRIWLEVTGIKIERVKDISHDDAMAEGVKMEGEFMPFFYVPGIDPLSVTAVGAEQSMRPAQDSYMKLWDHINGERAGCSWADNPMVTETTFRRVEKPAGL